MRLIDVDELAKYEHWKEIVHNLECAPTVDAVPVVHGEWVDKTKYTFKCSVCSCRSFGYDFCPHCGAKMDLNK